MNILQKPDLGFRGYAQGIDISTLHGLNRHSHVMVILKKMSTLTSTARRPMLLEVSKKQKQKSSHKYHSIAGQNPRNKVFKQHQMYLFHVYYTQRTFKTNTNQDLRPIAEIRSFTCLSKEKAPVLASLPRVLEALFSHTNLHQSPASCNLDCIIFSTTLQVRTTLEIWSSPILAYSSLYVEN